MHLCRASELPKTIASSSGMAGKMDSIGSLEIALKLVPGAKRVLFRKVAPRSRQKDRRSDSEWFEKWEGQLEFVSLAHALREMLAARVQHTPGSVIPCLGAFLVMLPEKT